MPQMALEPCPCCQTRAMTPPRRADADQVEHHGLERQQQRAEGAREEHEGDHGDEGDHQREVAVDGGDEVGVLGALSSDGHVARGVGGGAHPPHGGATRGGGAVRGGERVDERGPRATPGAAPANIGREDDDFPSAAVLRRRAHRGRAEGRPRDGRASNGCPWRRGPPGCGRAGREVVCTEGYCGSWNSFPVRVGRRRPMSRNSTAAPAAPTGGPTR